MPITERLDSVEDSLRWEDKIPFHYEYTAGIAGERFLRGIGEGKILAGYCPRCEEASLPARIYCVICYSPISRFVNAGTRATVKARTVRKASGGEVEAFAYFTFKGVRGGMVHRLLGDAKNGKRVRAVFRPRKQRTGAISDILGFRRDDR